MTQPHDGDRPIGIFDSGVGGLTVLRRVAERLPAEELIYLGDTARVPYGTKSAETVIRYARACAEILAEYDIKMLVVACNTASAFALDVLQDELSIPVSGVIEPGARGAVNATRNGKIGVIGTAGTIGSGAYQEAIHALAPTSEVYCKPCPLFVPLAEEGWTSGDVPQRVADAYLAELLGHGVDTLLLGCTHYPILKETIGKAAGGGIKLVDSAETTAEVVAETLSAFGANRTAASPPRHHFLVTDAPETFAAVGERFLARAIDNVSWVDF